MAMTLSGNMLDSLTVGRAAAGFFLFLIGAFFFDLALKPSYPKSLPRVGYGEGTVGFVRNLVGYMVYFVGWMDEGYEKVGAGGGASGGWHLQKATETV